MARERASWNRDGGMGGREARGQVEGGVDGELEETASHHWVAWEERGEREGGREREKEREASAGRKSNSSFSVCDELLLLRQ